MTEPGNTTDALLTPEEAADYLRISVGTVRNHAAAGTIPYLRAGGLLRFRRSELDNWLASHRQSVSNGEAA